MYQKRDFKNLMGIDFVSERLLRNHFNLYEGYVDNTNHLLDHLSHEDDEVRFAELKRRFGWGWNGMRLHELFFGNLTKDYRELELSSNLHSHIASSFGSIDEWQKDFERTAKTRGSGWVVLYFDKDADKLINVWINEHDQGHPSGGHPLLVLDLFEHAYMVDFDLDRKGYIRRFFGFIDWDSVESRYTASNR